MSELEEQQRFWREFDYSGLYDVIDKLAGNAEQRYAQYMLADKATALATEQRRQIIEFIDAAQYTGAWLADLKEGKA